MRCFPAVTTDDERATGHWWSRNLLLLCGVSFLQDAASELLYPILPIFLTVTLGAPVAVVGAVEGAAEGIAAVTKLISGRIADRRRPRRLVALGYGMAAAGKAVIALAGAWPVVLAGRGVDRVGKGIRGAPRDVLLVEGVPDSARGRAFGLHRTADTAGAVVGPLLGLALYAAFHHHIRPMLFIAVIPAVASVALVFAVKDREPIVLAPGEDHPEVRVPDRARRVIVVLTVFGLANFPDALLLLRASELGLGVAGVIGAYVVYNFSYAALSYPAGALSDRVRPAHVYSIGLLCFAVAYLGLGLADRSAWVWPLFLIYGGFTACTDGVGKAWISKLTPRAAQGRAQGAYQGATGGAILAAGLWAGFAWGGTGRTPLLISGTVALVIAAVLLAGRTTWDRDVASLVA
jgi:MFS family permease